jgi:hypothetical protein
MVIGSAALVNLKRIHRYMQAKMKAEEQQKKTSEQQECAQEETGISILSFAKDVLTAFFGQLQPQRLLIS